MQQMECTLTHIEYVKIVKRSFTFQNHIHPLNWFNIPKLNTQFSPMKTTLCTTHKL